MWFGDLVIPCKAVHCLLWKLWALGPRFRCLVNLKPITTFGYFRGVGRPAPPLHLRFWHVLGLQPLTDASVGFPAYPGISRRFQDVLLPERLNADMLFMNSAWLLIISYHFCGLFGKFRGLRSGAHNFFPSIDFGF